MEVFDEVRCVFHARGRDPGVFGGWVTGPFDQVLDTTSVGGGSCIEDLFDFVVIVFVFNNIRWGTGIVRAVFPSFLVRGYEGVVEDRVNAPSSGKLQTSVGGRSGKDFERSMAARGKLCFGVGSLDVSSF